MIMKKTIYKEPTFLRDIHKKQISNYESVKSLPPDERINRLVEEIHKTVKKLGLHLVEQK